MRGGTLLAVRADMVADLPEGVQKYVADHFKPMLWLGLDIFYASGRYSWDWDDHAAWKRGQMRGIAPTNHRLFNEYKIYEAGLPEGQSLADWTKAHPELIASLHVCGEREVHIDDD